MTDRNDVYVSYNAGPGTMAGSGGDVASFTNIQAVNNYIAVQADFFNGLYGEIGDKDICSPSKMFNLNII